MSNNNSDILTTVIAGVIGIGIGIAIKHYGKKATENAERKIKQMSKELSENVPKVN